MRPSDQDTVIGAGDATDPDDAPEHADVPETGPRLGPYTVLARIGRGGMGTVFAAYDLQLDRKIAVKVLHRTDDARARARVLREAQALAKLSHPNVVSVFATGEHDGRPYIAMEFIEGRDLARWKREANPDTDAIVATYLQAGRGLAAAHEAGLVHRDFKPANVMIDSRGRVKVLDFGLAQHSADTTGPAPVLAQGEPPAIRKVDLAAPLTRTGRTVGTPAYMAPEQMMAVRSDARADQFAFCVALWEAVYGERPFEGDTIMEILAEVADGGIRDPPRGRDSAWMAPHLRRGLASDPDARWPDLRALLDVLAAGAPTRGRRWVILLGATLAVCVGALALMPGEDSCSDGALRIAQVWNESSGQKLRETFAETDRPYVARLAAATAGGLDDYASAWADAYADACVDTRDNGQSASLRDARYACLNRSKRALRVLASALEQGDVQALEKVDGAIGTLPVLARCSNLDLVTAAESSPGTPEIAAAVEEITDELENIDRLMLLGRGKDAKALSEALAARVASVDHAPTRAAVYQAAARVALDADDGDAGIRWAEAAYLEAHDVPPATALEIHLALARAYVVEELYRAAQREVAVSMSLVERHVPNDLEFLRSAHNARGLVQYSLSNHKTALADFEKVLDLTEQSRGRNSAAAASAHLNLSGLLINAEELDKGLEHANTALEIWTRLYGPDHPDVARALHNSAGVLRRRGDFDAAQHNLDRSIELFTRAYGESNSNTQRARLSRGMLLLFRKDLDGTEAEARSVLDYAGDDLDQQQVLRASAHRMLGHVMSERGDFDASRREYEEAMALLERVSGIGSLASTELVETIAVLEAKQGNVDRALELHEDVLRMRRTHRASSDASIADAESNVGLMLAARGDCDHALPLMASGLDFWSPRLRASNSEAPWLTMQLAAAAMCAELVGDEEKARRFAQQATDFKPQPTPEVSKLVRDLALDVLENASGEERRSAASAVLPALDPPGVMLVRHWLEATAPNHPLPPPAKD